MLLFVGPTDILNSGHIIVTKIKCFKGDETSMRKFSQQWPYACFPAAETKLRDLYLVGAKGEPGCRAKPCSSQRTLTGRMRSPVFSRWVEEVIEEAQAAGQRRSWRDAGDKTP